MVCDILNSQEAIPSARFPAAQGKEERGMEARKKALPIGIEFFRDFRLNDYYYVDKTAFIAEFLRTKGAVNLFARQQQRHCKRYP